MIKTLEHGGRGGFGCDMNKFGTTAKAFQGYIRIKTSKYAFFHTRHAGAERWRRFSVHGKAIFYSSPGFRPEFVLLWPIMAMHTCIGSWNKLWTKTEKFLLPFHCPCVWCGFVLCMDESIGAENVHIHLFCSINWESVLLLFFIPSLSSFFHPFLVIFFTFSD